MATLTLLEKFYGPAEEDGLKFFQRFLFSVSSGLEASVKIADKTRRNWIQVEASGSDVTVLTNYLAQKSGLAPVSFDKLACPSELRGRIIDAGKVGYGLYVDIGVSSPETVDALIPLHTLRKQLVEDRKISTHKIIDAFCLHDNLPVKIRLTKITPDKKLEAELSDEQLTLFHNWLSSGLERIIALGVSSEMIENALKKSDSARDIIKIERLGFLEQALLCKLGTDAPGMINKLGRHLPRIPLYAFSSKKVSGL